MQVAPPGGQIGTNPSDSEATDPEIDPEINFYWLNLLFSYGVNFWVHCVPGNVFITKKYF